MGQWLELVVLTFQCISNITYIYCSNFCQVRSLSCVFSDCLDHNTFSFYAFHRELVQYPCSKLPNPKKVMYFSYDSTGQYKNRKNVINNIYHEQDLGLSAEWHFFTTICGKGPADEIGGTVKKLAAKTRRCTRIRFKHPWTTQLLQQQHT
jgi:hypothetical protein